jgi:hypothetical protein
MPEGTMQTIFIKTTRNNHFIYSISIRIFYQFSKLSSSQIYNNTEIRHAYKIVLPTVAWQARQDNSEE